MKIGLFFIVILSAVLEHHPDAGVEERLLAQPYKQSVVIVCGGIGKYRRIGLEGDYRSGLSRISYDLKIGCYISLFISLLVYVPAVLDYYLKP